MHLSKWLKLNKKKLARPLNARMVAGTLDHSYVAGRNITWYSHPGKWVAASYKIKYVITTQSSSCTVGHVSQEEKKENIFSHTHTNTLTPLQKVLIIALFIIVQNWKEPRDASTNCGIPILGMTPQQ